MRLGIATVHFLVLLLGAHHYVAENNKMQPHFPRVLNPLEWWLQGYQHVAPHPGPQGGGLTSGASTGRKRGAFG